MAPSAFARVDSSIAGQGTWALVRLPPKACDLDSVLDAIAPAVSPGNVIVPLLSGRCPVDALQARFGVAALAGGTSGIPAPMRRTRCHLQSAEHRRTR